ncbi:MAG TPA: DUF2167 domain-containing protein, partial [Burkholderiaceae bacterium]
MFALHGLRGLLIGVMALTLSLTASAQQDNKAAAEKAWNEAKAAAQNGPQDIPLAGLAVLHLPEGKTFIPRAQSVPLMHAMGNPGEYKDLQGLIFPTGEANWFTVVRYEASGHIKDDEAM